ncbi:ExbD/TolR family protein [Pelagicoccus albus]|uniref:Biopolymer transporter ExbD n=1 Tax=Pelagicoccus albus TaxID=415222 RepID=A0A7X1B4X6_9BACT|nr:biopolymer transporter ExbD [Pelagicoccus albus]MBC2605731.1 biopolymer transporter ExbD [Pelagicoccus albus]
MAIKLQGGPKRRKVAGISMAPMIDMVFLLLVFFMTASAMSQAGSKLELDLPESSNSKVARDFSNRLIVSIDGEGHVFLGSAPLSDKLLRTTLQDFRDNSPGGKLSIRASKETAFSSIKRVMSLAAEAGIDDFLYATYESGVAKP